MVKSTVSQGVPGVQSSPFQFHDHQIRTQLEGNQMWFVAKDVCVALGIDWSGKTLSSIPAGWQGMGKLPTPSGIQQVRTINEPAVYKLAFRSNKPAADDFTNWVASEVLPSIRKTGRYCVEPAQLLPYQVIRTLPKSMKDRLNDLVNTKLAHVPTAFGWKTRMRIWKQFNKAFHISRHDLLPKTRMTEAITFLTGLDVGHGGVVTCKAGLVPLPMSTAKTTADSLAAAIEQGKALLASLSALNA